MKPAPLLAWTASIICLVGAVTAGSNWTQFWLAMGTAGFLVEGYALHRKAKGDTLSETIWLETRPLYRRIPLGIFMVWLTLHFVFRL